WHEYFRDIVLTGDGNCIAIGSTESFSPTRDAWIIKFAVDGTFLWDHQISGIYINSAVAICLSPDIGFVIGCNAKISAPADYQVRFYRFGIECDFDVTPPSGNEPLTVQFQDKSIGADSWAWDFDGDGTIDNTLQNPLHIFPTDGIFSPSLTITGFGRSLTDTKPDFIHVYDIVSIEDNKEITESTFWSIPNPASIDARVQLSLPQPVPVSFSVYDIKGRKVSSYNNPSLSTGFHRIRIFPSKPLPASGLYFIKIKAGSFTATSKIIVVK
ncbi:MAG: T9SS type A sorting domain-containing protein, partial [Candidatus Cloacimonetes bacterium]|nr:T9SS type A sorting domain-containing protein [Candidatus Cloacimonadota bacterium]